MLNRLISRVAPGTAADDQGWRSFKLTHTEHRDHDIDFNVTTKTSVELAGTEPLAVEP